MTEDLFFTAMGVVLGTSTIIISIVLKEKLNFKQFMSLFSLGVVLLISIYIRTIPEHPSQLISNLEVKQEEIVNQSGFYHSVEKVKLMNADQTLQLGTYIKASTEQDALTKEEFLSFYEAEVVDTDSDWVTLILGGGNGITFKGATASFLYGELDVTHCVSEVWGQGMILDGYIEYSGN